MPKYRKKPVVIEAVQYDGTNGPAISEWSGELVFGTGDNMAIPTLEGEMMASVSDFIIKGIQGEFYPCKPDIFDATYELVEDV